MPDEDMVDFYVLANEVDGFNNSTIHTFLHSVHLGCLLLTRIVT